MIKRWLFDKLPAPQSVIDRVTALAKKFGVSSDLVFAYRHRIPFSWSESTSIEPEQAPIAPYPDIPAEIPGVCLCRHSPKVSPDQVISRPQETNWTQMADDAVANANLDLMDHLPPPPEIIDADDDADYQVPLVPSSSSIPVLPTVESDFSPDPPLLAPTSSSPQENWYLARVWNPPWRLLLKSTTFPPTVHIMQLLVTWLILPFMMNVWWHIFATMSWYTWPMPSTVQKQSTQRRNNIVSRLAWKGGLSKEVLWWSKNLPSYIHSSVSNQKILQSSLTLTVEMLCHPYPWCFSLKNVRVIGSTKRTHIAKDEATAPC